MTYGASVKKFLIIAAVVVFSLVSAVIVLTSERSAPTDCAFSLDLKKIRELASKQPGAKPSSVRVEQFTTFSFPRRAIAAGEALGDAEMIVYAYQVTYPDRTIMLDAALSAAQAEEAQASDYKPEAWLHLQKAFTNASAIYVTHEHADHLGGLFAGALPKNVHLTPEQMASPFRSEPAVISEEAKKLITPLIYEDAIALAPGLFAIKAPGHTPGSQWFYVQQADGKEILFVGDTAWHMMNIEHVQGPPQLVSWMLKNDRHANACQLKTLKDNLANLTIVPGHDGEYMKSLLAAGTLAQGFAF